MADRHVLCDLIIPADERSVSASQAGVPEFMDDWIAFRTEQDGNMNLRAEIFGGLMWLDRESNQPFEKNFRQLFRRSAKTASRPHRLSRESVPKTIRSGSHSSINSAASPVGGFFSSKAGVADSLSWQPRRGRMERLRSESLGDHRRAHEERVQRDSGSEALGGVNKNIEYRIQNHEVFDLKIALP